VTNYLMTIGLMSAAEEIGLRCPEDFALISFDDYPWSGCFRPRLTTIELPKFELGTTAVQLLLERIKEKRTKPVTVNLLPQLRVRESCGFMLQSRKRRTWERSPLIKVPHLSAENLGAVPVARGCVVTHIHFCNQLPDSLKSITTG